MIRLVFILLLTACVTTAPVPETGRVAAVYAPPSVTVRLADGVTLPRRYDDAVGLGRRAPVGMGEAWLVRRIEDGLTARLAAAYRGTAPSRLDLVIENMMLPDQLPAFGLAGAASFSVTFALTAADGAVIAESERPFVILPDFNGGFSFLGLFRARNWYDRNREAALHALAEETASVLASALSGGVTQTGLAGELAVHSIGISQ